MPTVGRLKDGEFLISGEYNERLPTFTAICFIDIFIAKRGPGVVYYHLNSAPVIAVAILILPIIDTLSVIVTGKQIGRAHV